MNNITGDVGDFAIQMIPVEDYDAYDLFLANNTFYNNSNLIATLKLSIGNIRLSSNFFNSNTADSLILIDHDPDSYLTSVFNNIFSNNNFGRSLIRLSGELNSNIQISQNKFNANNNLYLVEIDCQYTPNLTV